MGRESGVTWLPLEVEFGLDWVTNEIWRFGDEPDADVVGLSKSFDVEGARVTVGYHTGRELGRRRIYYTRIETGDSAITFEVELNTPDDAARFRSVLQFVGKEIQALCR